MVGPIAWIRQKMCSHPINYCMCKPSDPSVVMCVKCGKEFPQDEDHSRWSAQEKSRSDSEAEERALLGDDYPEDSKRTFHELSEEER